MNWRSRFVIVVLATGGVFTQRVAASDIGGIITTTLAVREDSQLIDDVTCTVSGAPCLDIVAPNVTLDLNGFTITGLGDPRTGCAGASAAGAEHGIRVLQQTGVTIRGPGIIQRFRGHGIITNQSPGATIRGVTTSINCLSGILVGSESNLVENNISIGNGNLANPCGGI